MEKRKIIFRTKGSTHGPITRLVSPGDVGELIKPFVFLDYVNAPKGPGFGFHPHSGIATLTYPLTFDVEHEASTSKIDLVEREGVEWVVAGGGIWHRGKVIKGDRAEGFQLWFALPPEAENSEPSSQFISPHEVLQVGPVRLLHGQYLEHKSLIHSPVQAHLMFVKLTAGDVWSYQPLNNNKVAWSFLQSGSMSVNGENIEKEFVVFEESTDELIFQAITDCAFLFGAAVKHNYDLVLGSHSVHSNAQALANGKARINEIGEQLHRDGKLG
jgi:redox-sensitive bicupin YhaK (pirin superfamily)